MLVASLLLDKILWIVIAAFAVYRVAQLFVMDDGPFMIFKRFRRFLGRQAAKDNGPGLRWSLSELFICAFCMGLWLSLIPAIDLAENVFEFFVIWFGIAGVQTYLQYKSAVQI